MGDLREKIDDLIWDAQQGDIARKDAVDAILREIGTLMGASFKYTEPFAGPSVSSSPTPLGAEDLERAARAFANDHFGSNKWDALTPEEQMSLGESVRAALLALNLPIEDQK